MEERDLVDVWTESFGPCRRSDALLLFGVAQQRIKCCVRRRDEQYLHSPDSSIASHLVPILAFGLNALSLLTLLELRCSRLTCDSIIIYSCTCVCVTATSQESDASTTD
jgi:hypothetical protein